jgi:hypothetical protein
MRCGYGIYYWPDGERYVGQWKDGLFHGHGVKVFPDGKSYSGQWFED